MKAKGFAKGILNQNREKNLSNQESSHGKELRIGNLKARKNPTVIRNWMKEENRRKENEIRRRKKLFFYLGINMSTSELRTLQ